MAKERVIRQMNEEQRRKILSRPDVVVHERSEPPEDPFYVPKISARTPGKISASELIDDDEQSTDQQ